MNRPRSSSRRRIFNKITELYGAVVNVFPDTSTRQHITTAPPKQLGCWVKCEQTTWTVSFSPGSWCIDNIFNPLLQQHKDSIRHVWRLGEISESSLDRDVAPKPASRHFFSPTCSFPMMPCEWDPKHYQTLVLKPVTDNNQRDRRVHKKTQIWTRWTTRQFSTSPQVLTGQRRRF